MQYVSVAMTIVLIFVLVRAFYFFLSGCLFNCQTANRCSFTCTSVLERQGGLSEARSCDAWILMAVWGSVLGQRVLGLLSVLSRKPVVIETTNCRH